MEQLVLGLLGGGGLTALVLGLLKYRADNRKTTAEGGRLDADADVIRWRALFDGLEAEIARLTVDNQALRASLNSAGTQLAELRVEAANAAADVRKATADVNRARDEIVRLQDRVDDLEAASR